MHAKDTEFSSTGARLKGTATFPDSPARTSGIVLIGGSGPADRHNGGLFDSLRDHFVDSGVAVLAYDKRGVGGSTGRWESSTVDDLAADAAAAVDALRGCAPVDGQKVGVLGHSEGGWVAMRLAALPRPPDHVILNSCPAVAFLESEVFALVSAGLSPREAESGGSLLQRLTAAAEAGFGLESGRRIVAAAGNEPWYPKLEAAGFALDQTTWNQLCSWGSYDPMSDLSVLTIPTLAILGADDPLVPVAKSMDHYEHSALLSGRNHETALFPDAGHRLHAMASGDFAPGYLSRLSAWVKEQCED